MNRRNWKWWAFVIVGYFAIPLAAGFIVGGFYGLFQ